MTVSSFFVVSRLASHVSIMIHRSTYDPEDAVTVLTSHNYENRISSLAGFLSTNELYLWKYNNLSSSLKVTETGSCCFGDGCSASAPQKDTMWKM
jgi:hypothetical protein